MAVLTVRCVLFRCPKKTRW